MVLKSGYGQLLTLFLGLLFTARCTYSFYVESPSGGIKASQGLQTYIQDIYQNSQTDQPDGSRNINTAKRESESIAFGGGNNNHFDSPLESMFDPVENTNGYIINSRVHHNRGGKDTDAADSSFITAEKRYLCPKYYVYNPVKGRCSKTLRGFRKNKEKAGRRVRKVYLRNARDVFGMALRYR